MSAFELNFELLLISLWEENTFAYVLLDVESEEVNHKNIFGRAFFYFSRHKLLGRQRSKNVQQYLHNAVTNKFKLKNPEKSAAELFVVTYLKIVALHPGTEAVDEEAHVLAFYRIFRIRQVREQIGAELLPKFGVRLAEDGKEAVQVLRTGVRHRHGTAALE